MNKPIDQLFDRVMDEIVPDTWTNIFGHISELKNERSCSTVG
jgi:hypothetical protein